MDKALAQIAYETYCEKLGRSAEWETVPEEAKNAWGNVAYEVLKAAPFTSWDQARREFIAENLR